MGLIVIVMLFFVYTLFNAGYVMLSFFLAMTLLAIGLYYSRQ